MSEIDINRDFQSVKALVGCSVFMTLATNSLKLHIVNRSREARYIWIDPPWNLYKEDVLVTTSGTCPHPSAPNYEHLFQDWHSSFAPLDGLRIVNAEVISSSDLIITLEDRYRIDVPFSKGDANDDLWYDHWYLSDLNAAEQDAAATP